LIEHWRAFRSSFVYFDTERIEKSAGTVAGGLNALLAVSRSQGTVPKYRSTVRW
jgi:hypothetical protein